MVFHMVPFLTIFRLESALQGKPCINLARGVSNNSCIVEKYMRPIAGTDAFKDVVETYHEVNIDSSI